jgi:hypothetical protein
MTGFDQSPRCRPTDRPRCAEKTNAHVVSSPRGALNARSAMVGALRCVRQLRFEVAQAFIRRRADADRRMSRAQYVRHPGRRLPGPRQQQLYAPEQRLAPGVHRTHYNMLGTGPLFLAPGEHGF